MHKHILFYIYIILFYILNVLVYFFTITRKSRLLFTLTFLALLLCYKSINYKRYIK